MSFGKFDSIKQFPLLKFHELFDSNNQYFLIEMIEWYIISDILSWEFIPT